VSVSQKNIAIRSLKWNVLSQILFKWAYLENLENWWCSLQDKFKFSDHSFTHLVFARWQDSMSHGQKSWIFFNFPHSVFVHLWTMCRSLQIKSVSGKKCRVHRMSKIAKSTQSRSNGHLAHHCSFYCLAHALDSWRSDRAEKRLRFSLSRAGKPGNI